MSEFTLNDGRKAEKVENEIDPYTKVTEVFVEPKPQKKLSQRITERLCVCEREIETIDETTGEVVNKIVERVCDQQTDSVKSEKTPLQVVEEKMSKGMDYKNYIFAAIIIAQIAVLFYVLYKM